jgi:hypothetical protein
MLHKNQPNNNMKKAIGLLLAVSVLVGACGPKSYYKTKEGKRKQKYYNEIQFGGKSAATMKKKF